MKCCTFFSSLVKFPFEYFSPRNLDHPWRLTQPPLSSLHQLVHLHFLDAPTVASPLPPLLHRFCMFFLLLPRRAHLFHLIRCQASLLCYINLYKPWSKTHQGAFHSCYLYKLHNHHVSNVYWSIMKHHLPYVWNNHFKDTTVASWLSNWSAKEIKFQELVPC